MKRTLIVVIASLVAALVVVAAATADHNWSDATGDANGAPDITALVGSNDAAGNVTIRFSVAMVPDSSLFLAIDTNLNGNLYDQGDYGIAAGLLPSGGVMSLSAGTDASGQVVQKALPSLKVKIDATSVTITFAKSELAIGDMFAFSAETVTGAMLDQDITGDQLPEGNREWAFVLETASAPAPTPTPAPATAFSPRIGQPKLVPATIVAGKRVTVSFPVTRSDSGARLTSGTMVCDPSVAGKVLPHAESFTGGTAKLSFLVPKTAKGKQLKVKVTITANGHAATKVTSLKIL